MVHAILKYDSKEFGEHIAVCGKVLTQQDNYSLKLDEITCVKCRINFINDIINNINKKIKLYTKYNAATSYLKYLENEKEKYEKMI